MADNQEIIKRLNRMTEFARNEALLTPDTALTALVRRIDVLAVDVAVGLLDSDDVAK
jgi:hypothetical protein